MIVVKNIMIVRILIFTEIIYLCIYHMFYETINEGNLINNVTIMR